MPALANAKHEAVLQAFLADPKRIGWRAYKAVYPQSSRRAAETGWSRLLKKAEVDARLTELKLAVATEVAETVKVNAQAVFDELVKIAFANLKDYFDDADGFVGMGKLTREQAAAIASLEIESYVEPAGGADELQEPQAHGGSLKRKTAKQQQVTRVKFKLHDKRAALVDLGKHFGLFETKRKRSDDGDEAPDGTAASAQLTPLELARRIAFALEQGARAAASAEKPKKGAKR